MSGGDRRGADAVLALALASGSVHERAASAAGVSVRTVQRRLTDPAFVALVRAARAESIDRAVGELAMTSTAAVVTLRKLLDCPTDSVRLGAARSILDIGSRLRSAEELEDRLQAVEEAMSARRWSRLP